MSNRVTFQKVPTEQGYESVQYEGFDKEYAGAPFLAVFLVGNDYDIWAMDNEHAIADVGRMYQDLEQAATIIGVYRLDQ